MCNSHHFYQFMWLGYSIFYHLFIGFKERFAAVKTARIAYISGLNYCSLSALRSFFGNLVLNPLNLCSFIPQLNS